jgi:DNA-binding LacI/PurR family transcriptional regulator
LNNVPGVKISDETRQRVLDAARELEYYPTAAARDKAPSPRMLSGPDFSRA